MGGLRSFSDGSVTNRKASLMIFSECQKFNDLPIAINVCVSHTMSCSIRWGLGNFEYGNIPRTAHSAQGVKKRNFDAHTDKFLRYEVEGVLFCSQRLRWVTFPP